MNTTKKTLPGYSILEVLIALGIIVISVSVGAILIFQSQSFSVDTTLNEEATFLAHNNLETALKTARDNFSTLVSGSSTSGNFTLEIIVENIDSFTKKVTSRASWLTNPLRPQKVELVKIITDWPNATPPPDPTDDGGTGTTGDWKNLVTLGSVDLGPGNSATDLDVKNKIVYMSASASAASKPDFFIVDATNGVSPFIVSSLNTGPTLNAIDVSGTYAYVANNLVSGQLQVIDVSNIASPSLLKTFQLPGVSGAGAVGNTIFFGYNKIFIGTKKATGPEFHIIDVSSPSNPVALGSFEIGDDVNSINVYGNIAYVATAANEEVKVLNIANPASITQIGGFDAPGTAEDGKTVWLVSKKLYLGRTEGGNDPANHELHIINVTTPSAPADLGSKNFAADINDLRVRNNIAFLATSDSNNEFQVWDIANPTNITFWSSLNFSQIASGIDYENNLIYMSVRSNDALRIITSH